MLPKRCKKCGGNISNPPPKGTTYYPDTNKCRCKEPEPIPQYTQ